MCIYYGAMQNYKNHAKFLPLFHFIAFPLVAAYWIYTAIQLKNGIDTPHVMAFIGAFGVVASTHWIATAVGMGILERGPGRLGEFCEDVAVVCASFCVAEDAAEMDGSCVIICDGPKGVCVAGGCAE